jgi:hypothetical protein
MHKRGMLKGLVFSKRVDDYLNKFLLDRDNRKRFKINFAVLEALSGLDVNVAVIIIWMAK